MTALQMLILLYCLGGVVFTVTMLAHPALLAQYDAHWYTILALCLLWPVAVLLVLL